MIYNSYLNKVMAQLYEMCGFVTKHKYSNISLSQLWNNANDYESEMLLTLK